MLASAPLSEAMHRWPGQASALHASHAYASTGVTPAKPEMLTNDPGSLVVVAPQDARKLNALMPVSRDPLIAASAFHFAGAEAERGAARTCLAAAVLYEAGDNRPGEQAVAQVVLNRVRHPSYPKTVCGVVFQGTSIGHGCQFTFTCDGSLNRLPRADAWKRALDVADAALSGSVFASVGVATHYHADWVVPYWRSSLSKLAVVGPHIFYRIKGWAGSGPAFIGRLAGREQMDPRIVSFPLASRAVDLAVATVPMPAGDQVASLPQAPQPPALHIDGVLPAELKGNAVRLIDRQAGAFVLKLDPTAFSGSYAVVAFSLCRSRPTCLVMGWRQESELPSNIPSGNNSGTGLSFMFRKDSASGATQIFWNCRQTPRAADSECLPGTHSA